MSATQQDPGIWLITSGAYVSQELAIEFGNLPPVLLPVGVKRLYEYQLERLGAGHRLFLTLPEAYVIGEHDQARLDELGVTVLAVPEGLSLGESIVFALNLISLPDQPVRILHGDTLIDGLDVSKLDHIGVADAGADYTWAEVQLEDGVITSMTTVVAGTPGEQRAPIACGWFSFSSSAALVRNLTRARGDFLRGITLYGTDHPLRVLPVLAWYDFGHVGTFFRSRRLLVSSRAFNSLHIDGLVARKSSDDIAKMRAEADWLRSVPPRVRLYSARLIDAGEDGGRGFYETEYAYLPTLGELFVFGTLGRPSWMRILKSCRAFLDACVTAHGPDSADVALRALAETKTIERLIEFRDQAGFDIHGDLRFEGKPVPSMAQIADMIAARIDFATGRRAIVMHGDFCFSNILYNSRVERIQVIDPRGYTKNGDRTIFGDLRYDLAKLSHSVFGRYDQIIAGRYAMSAQGNSDFSISFEAAAHHPWLEAAMREMVIDGVAAHGQDVRALTIGLFLAMLPLHADRPDRQRAFIANALRLFVDFDRSGG